jgi:hypothetical protein
MPKFILERHMDAAEFMQYKEQNQKQLWTTGNQGILFSEVRWLESIVTQEKIYDIYLAPKADVMMEFASYQGLPIRSLLTITNIIRPDQGKEEDSPEKML